MNIGYCRISTQDQSLALQKDALAAAGCDRTFEDIASGALDERPGLIQALSFVRKGDCLCVWKLDRLGRSLGHLITVVNDLKSRGIGFRSLQENLDSTTPGGRLVFHLFGALAEFERELIRERTKAGLAAARARGRIGGRPSKLGNDQLHVARTLLVEGKTGVGEIAKMLQVSRATLYRNLASRDKQLSSLL